MREKLNKNPMAQAGIVLLLLVAAAFMLLKGSGGEESEEAVPTEATVAVAGTDVSGTATAATPGAAVEGAISAAEGAVSTTASAVATPLPAPPLPKPVTNAYESGKTVVLLIVHDGGIDDALARQSVESLSSMSDVALFVVPVHQIARYAAITLGVDVNRVPALVVVRPKDLSDGIPEASVSYGLQTPQGVEQAVRDARYSGPIASYHPE